GCHGTKSVFPFTRPCRMEAAPSPLTCDLWEKKNCEPIFLKLKNWSGRLPDWTPRKTSCRFARWRTGRWEALEPTRLEKQPLRVYLRSANARAMVSTARGDLRGILLAKRWFSEERWVRRRRSTQRPQRKGIFRRLC